MARPAGVPSSRIFPRSGSNRSVYLLGRLGRLTRAMITTRNGVVSCEPTTGSSSTATATRAGPRNHRGLSQIRRW